jgi:cysteinyl-tRNA synthetase
MFPHHENEIAQSEGAFGQPLARYWIHNGLLTVNGEKMSKSLGNYFTIQEILEAHDAAALRHLFMGSHYRSPMDFSTEALEEAGRATDRIHETLERAGQSLKPGAEAIPEAGLLEAFHLEMDDDFNTPRALALIFDEARALNRSLDEKPGGIEARGGAALDVRRARAIAIRIFRTQEGALAEKGHRQPGRDRKSDCPARRRAPREKLAGGGSHPAATSRQGNSDRRHAEGEPYGR